ncbi:phosphonatase-like hydrolase [Murinocardiopsis flavida]|uniref:Phosphonatase-like hydrolase n=1 Tax=Murinocardiopsis flavida TaxID=645275 RepID=A0A2P8DI45_9ACTN|nr:phosphonatase-like hydrolase [Murinocardiopsis flavida]PSK96904.1 phosphonatase-like hydrolase [Murinocardiopsis flavida]
MIELVVLDMAGTTIEEHGAVYAALGDAAREAGATIGAADVQHWMGADKETALAGLLRTGGRPEPAPETVGAAFDRFRTLLAAAYGARPPEPIPGAADTIAQLRASGVKVALTTGFTRDVAEPLLASLGWQNGVVDAVVCSDEVAAGRPAPHLIHRAMERTGVFDVRTVLSGGDTVVDLVSGHNAGAGEVVGVLTGKLGRAELERHPHTHIVPGVADIPGLLRDRARA